jgi:hypothetical protein
VMMASRPKVNIWPDGSISPGNYGRLFVLCSIFIMCRPFPFLY